MIKKTHHGLGSVYVSFAPAVRLFLLANRDHCLVFIVHKGTQRFTLVGKVYDKICHEENQPKVFIPTVCCIPYIE